MLSFKFCRPLEGWTQHSWVDFSVNSWLSSPFLYPVQRANVYWVTSMYQTLCSVLSMEERWIKQCSSPQRVLCRRRTSRQSTMTQWPGQWRERRQGPAWEGDRCWQGLPRWRNSEAVFGRSGRKVTSWARAEGDPVQAEGTRRVKAQLYRKAWCAPGLSRASPSCLPENQSAQLKEQEAGLPHHTRQRTSSLGGWEATGESWSGKHNNLLTLEASPCSNKEESKKPAVSGGACAKATLKVKSMWREKLHQSHGPLSLNPQYHLQRRH